MTFQRGPLFAAVFAVSSIYGGIAVAQPDQPSGADSGDPLADDAGEPMADDSGMPAADAEPAAETTASAEPAAGYKKGFYLQDPNGPSKMKIGGRVQGRLTYEALDDSDDEANFTVARARIKLSGNAFRDDIGYRFELDMGKGGVTLKDYIIDYDLTDEMFVRVGQWKRPFSRQQISSSGRLELVDRAITDKAFVTGRDVGLAVGNNYEKSPEGLEWVVGVFNGQTSDKPVFDGDADPMTGEVSGKFTNFPDMFGPMVVARAGWNSANLKGYSEADLEGGPFRYGVAAAAMVELDADDDDQSLTQFQLDYIGKVNGLSTTLGLYVSTAQDDTDFANQAFAAFGAHAQAGYMLDDHLQPAVRVAMVAFDDDAEADQLELAGGVSYYSIAHNFKLQTDLSLIRETVMDASTNNVMVRSQLQLAF